MALQRREVAILALQLQQLVNVPDTFQVKALLAKVMHLSHGGEDLNPVLPVLVQLLAHRDAGVKKAVGEVLAQHSDRGAHATLLAINTLVQDCQDSNPMVRGLALRTLSSLEQESVVEHLQGALAAALADRSAYVRRVAVLACPRLHRLSPTAVREAGMVDKLYAMIRDRDPVVVVNCLWALEEVLESEGGVVLNRPMVAYLLRQWQTLPSWCHSQILGFLKKYAPASDDELFVILSAVDSCFTHNNSAVVGACLDLFLHLLRSHPHLQSEVFKRSEKTLVGFLGLDDVELSFVVLGIISEAPKAALSHFTSSFQSFFCRNKDPLYLKVKKIKFLPQLITEDNGAAILEELNLHCLSNSPNVSLEAVRALGLIQQEKPFLSEACLEKLGGLMQSSSPHVLSNLLQVLRCIDPAQISEDRFWEQLVGPIQRHFHGAMDDPGRAAMLYLIGEHLRDCEEAFAILEECVDQFAELQDREVKCQVLTATTKMFLQHPLELQSLLGGLLEVAVADSDLEVKSRAQFLYSLLQVGPGVAKTVLFAAPT